MSWDTYKAEHPDRASKSNPAHGGSDDAEWRGLGDEAPDWFTGEGDTRSVRVMNYCYTELESVSLACLADGRCVPKEEAGDGVGCWMYGQSTWRRANSTTMGSRRRATT